jgi:hypothetical protein
MDLVNTNLVTWYIAYVNRMLLGSNCSSGADMTDIAVV